MALLEGSKSVSTSIGGSTQTVNFLPIINARGASSGPVTNEGFRISQAPTVTTQQNSGPDDSGAGVVPRLSLPSTGAVEAIPTGSPNYLSPAARSFAPAAMPAPADPAFPVESTRGPSPLVLLGGLAVVALVVALSWR